MKNNILAVIFLTLLMSSCYKDIGSYDYDETEVISIDGVQGSYTGIAMVDSLNIVPEVASTDPDAEFDYFWAMYLDGGTGVTVELDTLSHTKDLHLLISQSEPSWKLIFSATNKNTGLSKLVSCDLHIETAYTRGWYVLKDNGTNSDIDMYLTPDTIVPASVSPNVYSTINGQPLNGKAKMLNYFISYKTFIDIDASGRAKNTKVLIALTENDIAFNHINTMEKVRGFDDFAYEAPAVKNMGYIGFSYYGQMYYAINDGKLHKIAVMYPNSGVFSSPVARDEHYTDYHLSDFALTSTKFRLFYDETSGSFVTHGGGIATTMSNIKTATASEMPAVNTNKELLYMGLMDNTQRNTPAVAIMRDKSDNSMSLFRIKPLSFRLEMTISNLSTIDNTQKLHKASLITTSQDEAVLYFAVGNELWSRNLSSGLEQLQFAAPDGEEITMIRHRKYSGSKEPNYAYNYVIVGTSSTSGNYKVHFFQKRAGNLESAPDFTQEGSGTVKDILFISPNISESTYMQGY